MNVLLRISLRNLFRQKRRNVLLGIAISFGALILILANSFAHGISDVLFNQIISYAAGHVSVTFTNNGNMYSQVFYDKDLIMNTIRKTVPEVKNVQEAIGTFSRVIGNGKSDNLIMVGFELHVEVTEKELKKTADNFKMIVGRMEDIADSTVENPVVLSEEKANYLNVRKNDFLRVRFTDIHGQQQAARLTVVGIFKPSNIFMNSPMFLEIDNVKKLTGYGPHDLATVFLTIKDPKCHAIKLADSLHKAFKPPIAVITGIARGHAVQVPVKVFGFKSDTASRRKLISKLHLDSAGAKALSDKKTVLISSTTASVLGLSLLDTCTISYTDKFTAAPVTFSLIPTVIVKTDSLFPESGILVSDRRFFEIFYTHWPKPADSTLYRLDTVAHKQLLGLLSTEWVLLERVNTTKDAMKQYSKIGKNKYYGTTVDVSSMYETASDILKIEVVLNVITISAVMVLFFIILIGVVNTLRMTIRERTREIGTTRAIGMQKKDVRNVFILETFFLALFSSLTGTVLSFLFMQALSLVTFNVQDNPLGMILVKGHLHFTPSVAAIILFNLLICAIAATTAYFPARRAANLSAVEALRHYE
jgi:ABC-type lipoprotein release transport system permease subunit